ncbi:MAG: sporulation protein YqfD, partial [Clostridia bacterium]|nr:sporulation protein YqfD [Clostridia bacterium]
MMHSRLSLIRGYVELTFRCQDRVEVYDLLLHKQLGSFGYRTDGETFIVCIYSSALPILEASMREKNIQPICAKKRGLVPVLCRYKMRAGIFFGAFVFAFLVIFSGRLIWDVRIEGNVDLSEGEIVSALSDVGLSIGTFHSRIDPDAIAIKLLQNKKELSWASINIKGNVAYVEVLENEQGAAEKNDPIYGANLV